MYKYKKEDGMIANETVHHKRPKMTRKLTTIGHHMAINNEQSQYPIISYKKPRNDNIKQYKGEN